ncbi:MAG TPA: bifunctional adenosylcobinamide kinase/adenosylcobinamide-phosphate guanylyltransferase [Candidatus Limnocylindrales bacterium]|nr:bifunctional adenosylcobinamide kinase/adenosylcobinamide-phosphate guanylyltransferase [Candidatus Limnocylindrales bacterium]
MADPLVLVLGGTRSGKSTFGRQRVRELAGDGPVAYLATAWSDDGDSELDNRIERHRRERPANWTTIEVGPDLAGAIGSASDAPILLDGLTLWLSAVTADGIDDIDATLDGAVAAGLAAIEAHAAPVVVVSDEIGLGMVPIDPGARAFRDLQGIVHQRIASAADEVYLTVAGLPLALKPTA